MQELFAVKACRRACERRNLTLTHASVQTAQPSGVESADTVFTLRNSIGDLPCIARTRFFALYFHVGCW
jgi:hypothetical protein